MLPTSLKVIFIAVAVAYAYEYVVAAAAATFPPLLLFVCIARQESHEAVNDLFNWRENTVKKCLYKESLLIS